MIGEKEIILTCRPEPTANGDYKFSRDGVKASVYVNKRIFKRGTIPQTITLSSEEDVFRLPGNLDSEAMTKRIAMLKDRVDRKRHRAEQDLTQADELHGKMTKLNAALDVLGQ